MDKIKELREKRQKLVVDQRALIDKAGTEKRALTAEEETSYQNMDKEFDTLTAEIDTIVKEAESKRNAELRKKQLEEREKLLRQSAGDPIKPDTNGADLDKRGKVEFAEYRYDKRYQPLVDKFREMNEGKRSSKKYMDAYRRFLVGGENALTHEDRNMLFNVTSEVRALQADSDKAGGYLVAPEQMVVQIIEALDNSVFVRGYANVIPVPNAASLGAPARDTDIGDPTWTAEILTGSLDSTLDFGKRELTPHPLARAIKVSKRLVRVAVIDIAAYISKRLAYKMAVVEENAFLNGTGINSPLGVFTASPNGISASRDIATGNTTTGITADGLINAKYNLPKQYRQLPSCRWCFHRSGVKMIRKLKDGEGNYLWKQGLTDKPDTILEIPFEESEYAPSTFTTGLYVGILGDWAQYWIADSLAMEIQVVLELYSATNQNGYFCRKETDGMPVMADAFSRIKLA